MTGLLLLKLHAYVIHKIPVTFIYAYLSQRKLKAKGGSTTSELTRPS